MESASRDISIDAIWASLSSTFILHEKLGKMGIIKNYWVRKRNHKSPVCFKEKEVSILCLSIFNITRNLSHEINNSLATHYVQFNFFLLCSLPSCWLPSGRGVGRGDSKKTHLPQKSICTNVAFLWHMWPFKACLQTADTDALVLLFRRTAFRPSSHTSSLGRANWEKNKSKLTSISERTDFPSLVNNNRKQKPFELWKDSWAYGT